jgi:hypothetical protein
MHQASKAQHRKGDNMPTTTDPQKIPLIPTILVEEENRIRRNWSHHFRSRNLPFWQFSSPESFHAGLPTIIAHITNDTQFYLDQDFGNRRGLGVKMAKEIREAFPKVWIALVTAYPPDYFQKELFSGILNAVLPKYPRHIFGDFFDDFAHEIASRMGSNGNTQLT